MTDFKCHGAPLEKKVKLVRQHFNSIAGKYDLMNSLLSFGLHHYWKRKAVGELALKTGDRVIDVCGGTADLSILAAKAVGSAGQVILYDNNRAMMEAGKPKIVKTSLEKKILFVQGDAVQISFPGGIFDAAIVGFGIRNLTCMEKGLEEMRRILQPGGKLVCLEFSRPTSTWFGRFYDLYSFQVIPLVGKIIAGSRKAYTYLPESIRLFPSPDQLSAILEKIGFSHVDYHRLTNGIAVVHTGVKTP